jgi:predicted transcriptional regulator
LDGNIGARRREDVWEEIMGQAEIYELLKKEPMTSSELAKALGVRQSSIINATNKMIKSKIVRKEFIYQKKSGRQYLYTLEGDKK